MLLGFGEMMMRVAPRGVMRLRQVTPGSVDITFAGGEANVCVAVQSLGGEARYLTALPKHTIADSLVETLRGIGVDTSRVLRRDEGRLGIYFVETGANQRSSVVVYDRDYSAVSLTAASEYDFDAALDGVTWVHVTGITPAISEHACKANLALVERARKKGITVSCDLNFRKKLWRWRPGTEPKELARECMSQLLPHVDLVVGNEEDASDVLGIEAKGTSVEAGVINAKAYEDVARTICGRFDSVQKVAITLRESISASHNNWGAMLYDRAAETAHLAPLDVDGNYTPYEIRNIVDRVGGGDSFAGGLIYALMSEEYSDPESALRFAVATSCLKHSILGDWVYVGKDEVVALMRGQASGRVRR